MERKWNYYQRGTQESARTVALYDVWHHVSTYSSPANFSGEDAWVVLDEVARRNPKSLASYFYNNCSDTQSDLFVKDWESKWRNWNLEN